MRKSSLFLGVVGTAGMGMEIVGVFWWVGGVGKEWKVGSALGESFMFFLTESSVTFSLDIAVVVASRTSSTFGKVSVRCAPFFYSTNFQRLSDFRCSILSDAIHMRSDF